MYFYKIYMIDEILELKVNILTSQFSFDTLEKIVTNFYIFFSYFLVTEATEG